MDGSKDILVNILGDEIRAGFNKSTLFISSHVINGQKSAFLWFAGPWFIEGSG